MARKRDVATDPEPANLGCAHQRARSLVHRQTRASSASEDASGERRRQADGSSNRATLLPRARGGRGNVALRGTGAPAWPRLLLVAGCVFVAPWTGSGAAIGAGSGTRIGPATGLVLATEVARFDEAVSVRRQDEALALPLSLSPSGVTPQTQTPPQRQSQPQTSSPRAPELGRWPADTFGEGKARSTFVPELRRLIVQVRQRLAALRALPAAPRAPSGSAGPTAPAARARAERQARVDRQERQLRLLYGALRTDLDALDARFAVLFGSTARGLPESQVPADWRPRAEAAAGYAAALDGLVQQLLLTHDDLAPGDTDGAEARTARTFAALWDAINAPPSQPAATQEQSSSPMAAATAAATALAARVMFLPKPD